MSARLARMVVRVDASLSHTLSDLSDRLLGETMDHYSYSAIVRGLLRCGLVMVATTQAPLSIAPFFAGTREGRVRNPGARWSRLVELDLIKDDDDLDIEFEDEHHDAFERRQIVARDPRPPRGDR